MTQTLDYDPCIPLVTPYEQLFIDLALDRITQEKFEESLGKFDLHWPYISPNTPTWVRPILQDLSPNEQKLLLALVERPGKMLTAEALVDILGWTNAHALRINVGRLRKKLPKGVEIENVRFRGYRLIREERN